MNPQQVVSNEHMDTLQSPYTCIICGEGSMIPAVQEGEPEYTDNYLCVKCQFHDTIPTHGILLSQISTSILGLAVCGFLLYDYVLFSRSATSAPLTISLSLIIAAFLIGFFYVLYKAYKGHQIRKSYLQREISRPT